MADPIANPFPPDPNLTPVHLAVLQDDLAQLSALVRSREWGIDALDARRATPIMLAALSGRPTAFLFLLENGASLRREDAQGLTAVDYLRAANVESLASRYQPHARKRFSKRRGRLMIRATLKALRQSPQGGSEKADTSSPVPPPGRENDTMPPAQAPSADETLEIILHTKEKDVIFGTLSIQARAYFEQDLHEKTMGAIRGRAQGSPFHVIAISGWRGDQACKGTTVLNNAQYTALVKEVSQMYGLALRSNPLDKVSVLDPFCRHWRAHDSHSRSMNLARPRRGSACSIAATSSASWPRGSSRSAYPACSRRGPSPSRTSPRSSRN